MTPSTPDNVKITPESQLPSNIPQPYYETPSPESQAHRTIRRMDWESLGRHVNRITERDSFNTQWTFALLGGAVAAFIGLVTVVTEYSNATPHTAALEFLGGLTAVCLAMAYFVNRIEQRALRNWRSHLSALKEEMTAMERYMTDVSEQKTK